MKRSIGLGICILAMAGCATTAKTTGSETAAASAEMTGKEVVQRNPAMHVYAGYDCTSGKYELDYDGPGSNRAVGGYGHLYKKIRGGKKVSVMTWETGQEESETNKIGDKISDETLGLIFTFTTKTAKQKASRTTDTHPGDKCTPAERDYQHIEWSSKRVLEVTQVSAEAAAKLGVHKGDVLRFVCRESEDMPIQCPESGVYGHGDLEE